VSNTIGTIDKRDRETLRKKFVSFHIVDYIYGIYYLRESLNVLSLSLSLPLSSSSSSSSFNRLQNVELPETFSRELRSLLEGLLQRDINNRLGCRGNGADELKAHPFFKGIDWQQVYLQKYTPPLIPPRGEVNAADAFDIGSFDEEDTKGIKLTEADQDLYKNFPLVISERWQAEVAETVFETINNEADKVRDKYRSF